MKNLKRSITFILLLGMIWGCSTAPEDPAARAERLGKQLRCPVCRGVPIADSPAELAQQMMGTVRAQIAAGKSDAEILSYFEERYGEWALLQPKAEGANLLIWILPLGFIMAGAIFIVWQLGKQRDLGEA